MHATPLTRLSAVRCWWLRHRDVVWRELCWVGFWLIVSGIQGLLVWWFWP